MAITRAQQVRQMLKNAGAVEQDGVMNYIKNSESVTVPKEFKARSNAPATKLAYITADEAKMLKKEKPGTPHKGPKGIPSYDSFDAQGNYSSGEAMSAAERGDIAGAQREGMSENDARDVRAGAVAAGAGARDSDDRDIQKRAEQIKKESAKRRRDAAKAITKEERIEARKTRKRMQALKQRDLLARQERIKGILGGKKSFTYTDPITGEVVTQDLNPAGLTDTELADLEALGLDPAFQGPMTPSQQIAFDNIIEKSDKLSGVNLEAFQNKFNLPKTGITSIDLIAGLLEGPLKAGSKKTREFFSDPNYMGLFGKKKPSVLEAGKFTYEGLPIDPTVFGRLGTAEMEEIYGNYMDKRMGGEIDAYGNPIIQRDDSGPSDPCLGPNPPAYCFIGQRAETPPEDPIFTPAFRFMNRGGMVEDAPMGGIMDLETTRQMLFIGGVAKAIGKGLKSVTRGIKKVAKSPLGKAAILGTIGYGLGGGKLFGGSGFSFGKLPGAKFFSDMTLPKLITDNMTGLKVAGLSGLAGLLLANVGKDDDDDFDVEEYYRTAGIDIPQNQYRFLAEGGSTEKEPVAKKTMPLLDLEGQEMDFRQDGGFVPIGRMEKADDVPARLSKNEFVFTAEAVRNAGGGDVDKGAEVMYNTMKNLEAGGEVSEETQGLEGARNMFQTSQRLGEVV